MGPYVAEHLQYKNGLDEQGLLWGSGPFIEPGVVVGDGLTIFNVAEEADVHKLMAEEPLVKHGLRSYSVRKRDWRRNDFHRSISFSIALRSLLVRRAARRTTRSGFSLYPTSGSYSSCSIGERSDVDLVNETAAGSSRAMKARSKLEAMEG
jgi:uncharacterized protein YciI